MNDDQDVDDELQRDLMQVGRASVPHDHVDDYVLAGEREIHLGGVVEVLGELRGNHEVQAWA
eukprot:6896252-Heterocapsa_arctica.AAC.1